MNPPRNVLHAIWCWLRFWIWRRPRAWLKRQTLWVDSRHGNDDSPGTQTAPIRTLAELHQRTTGITLHGDLNIELCGDFSSENLVLDPDAVDGVVVTCVGGPPATRARHKKALEAFLIREGNAEAREFPTPPSSVGPGGVLKLRRGRVGHLKFGDSVNVKART